jgi:hypothetical protein
VPLRASFVGIPALGIPAVQFSTIQFSTIQFSTIQFSTIQFLAVRHLKQTNATHRKAVLPSMCNQHSTTSRQEADLTP